MVRGCEPVVGVRGLTSNAVSNSMGRTFAGLRRRIMVVSADATAKRGIDTSKPAACRRCDGQAHKYAEAIPNWRVMGAESVQSPLFAAESSVRGHPGHKIGPVQKVIFRELAPVSALGRRLV